MAVVCCVDICSICPPNIKSNYSFMNFESVWYRDYRFQIFTGSIEHL